MEHGPSQEPQGGERRGSQDLFKDLWSQALVTMGAAEEEVKKLLDRLSEVVEIKPDDVLKYRRELSERLRTQRRDLEKSVEEGLRRALSRLKVPSREEIDALRGKIDDLGARLERLSSRRRAPTGGAKR
ncbi:MAG TPA: phasin family protein [Myxococcales bacterium]|jgi:poly(hydroxyalkanoate) granule-associated protein|nr:phasin family protein [Myxococcales bacterium]